MNRRANNIPRCLTRKSMNLGKNYRLQRKPFCFYGLRLRSWISELKCVKHGDLNTNKIWFGSKTKAHLWDGLCKAGTNIFLLQHEERECTPKKSLSRGLKKKLQNTQRSPDVFMG